MLQDPTAAAVDPAHRVGYPASLPSSSLPSSSLPSTPALSAPAALRPFSPARGDAQALAVTACRTFCFSIFAQAEPGIMPRVLELFAKRNLVPNRWHSDRHGLEGGELSIDLQLDDLAPELGEYIARCLRQIFGVRQVLTSQKF